MDPNRLNRENNFQVRLLAAKLMTEWQNADEVAHVLGCRRSFVRKWYQRFRQGGQAALYSATAAGRPSKLNMAQKAVVKEILFNRSPLEFGLNHALWTNRLVLDLIDLLYQIKLRMPSVNNLLESYGVKHAPFEATVSPKEILARAKIALNAKHGKFMLFFRYPIEIASNESGDRPSADAKHANDRRQPPTRAWLAGAIDTRHTKWFMISYREPIDDQFVTFLEKLIYHKTETITLVVAETRILDAPAVHTYLGTCHAKLRLIRDAGPPWRDNRDKSGE